jgi:hypothetical protein
LIQDASRKRPLSQAPEARGKVLVLAEPKKSYGSPASIVERQKGALLVLIEASHLFDGHVLCSLEVGCASSEFEVRGFREYSRASEDLRGRN